MASLWKRENSKYWTACYTDKTGKQRKRSTGTTDRKEAQKIAEEYETAARRRRTARQVRQVIADLHHEFTGEELPTVTVASYMQGWLERKKPETAPSTLAFYAKTVKKFLTFLGDDGKQDLAEITREHVTRFRNEESKTLAAKTANHDLKCLKMIFKAARRDSALVEDPAEFVDTIRQTRPELERRPFTIPEIQAVLAVADDEWRSLIRFGLYTGQRLADLACLTWENVDLDRREVRLATRKTGRRMILPMAAPLRIHIEGLATGDKPNAPLHPRAAALVARGTRNSILSRQFGELLAQAGLRPKASHQRRERGPEEGTRRQLHDLSFHCLRRTAATMLHEAGIPAAVAQELIGHDSEEAHRLYVNVGREALEKAAASLPVL